MGELKTKDGLSLHYEEFGTGDRVILSAMAGLFYPDGLQQALARRGYHVYCMSWRSAWSSKVIAHIASTIGTARGTTQGSCLPLAFNVVFSP